MQRQIRKAYNFQPGTTPPATRGPRRQTRVVAALRPAAVLPGGAWLVRGVSPFYRVLKGLTPLSPAVRAALPSGSPLTRVPHGSAGNSISSRKFQPLPRLFIDGVGVNYV